MIKFQQIRTTWSIDDSSSKRTKPKPRDCWVWGSLLTVTSFTAPNLENWLKTSIKWPWITYCSKYARRDSPVVCLDNPPTNIFPSFPTSKILHEKQLRNSYYVPVELMSFPVSSEVAILKWIRIKKCFL